MKTAGLFVCWALSASAQITLPTVVVSASRAPQSPGQVPFSLVLLAGDTLRATPTTTLDGALRAVPGFSLFRRSDSLTAHPTAQGVSLRGLGPSGASRSLVLLDGLPLNDPFGGWVSWSKVPRETLSGAELVRGGGATAWGNAALGGVVQLFTETPAMRRARVAVSLGDYSTRSAEFSLSQSAGRGSLQLSGRGFSTAGVPLVAPEDRGPVDLAAWSRHHWLAGRWNQPVGPDTTLTFFGRTYREKRGNGTIYQRNASQENFGAVTLEVKPGASFAWTATAYAQDQSFASTFSAVNATRTAETPANNQFDVPATAYGAAWTGVVNQAGDARTSFGVDLRRTKGETREHFTFASGDFTRLRVAGGSQVFAGLFALHERPLTPALRLTLGVRLDHWNDRNGHRFENERATGTVLRNDHYTGRDGVEFSPSAGLVWTPTKEWRVRAAAQQAFRRPTLNELYRPFRVGNVITEANAALDTERVTNAEIGTDWTRDALTLGAAVFWNDLRDVVGNVTIARGPGTFPVVGFVPAGGLGRQRLNLDRIRVQGLELSARWRPTATLSLSADYLYLDATVRAIALAPDLIGKRLPQVPRQSASFGASWQPMGKLTITPRVRALDRQFEDDENLLRLGAALVVDLGAGYRLNDHRELYLTAENLTDERIETGRSPDGIVNTGTPRFISGGFRTAW